MKSFALILSLLAATAFAKEEPLAGKYSVGVGAGMTGGMGLSVKRWLSDKGAVQINFIPVYTEERYPGDDDGVYADSRDSGHSNSGFVSLGALYQHMLASYDGLGVFTYGGGNYMGVYKDDDYYTSNWSGETVEHQVRSYARHILSVGGGLGGMLTFWRIELTGMLGVVGAYDARAKTRNLTPAIDVAAHFRL